MLLSRRWLEDFLRRPLEISDLSDRLGMLGAPVDAVTPLYQELAAVVVGRVESVERHPDADRLTVCQVSYGGDETITVVCGAPNVTAGKLYPYAKVGTTLPGGLTLEKRKIRGIASNGMLCSARELELGEEHDGILELETNAPPGTPLTEVLDLADHQLEIDVTPNRPDLLGHKGVARELAADLGIQFRLPEIPGAGGSANRAAVPAPQQAQGGEGQTAGVRIAIDDREGCSRFLAGVVRGVTIGPSPEWLRRRLLAVGLRPINNVVDATNYVLMETGQPLHAYDLEKIAGPEVIARRALAGEKLVTLDGKERELTQEMTAIADDSGAIGVGGVMGGSSTEVSDSTTDLLLECANFDPSRIRGTRTRLGLSTDASYRFERGVDRWAAPDAFRRCLEVILATAGGSVESTPVDVYPEPANPPRIFLRPARVAQVLGEELPWGEIESHLVAIGATVVSKPDDGRIAVDVPGWRPDLTEEIDLVEEVARVRGYDSFPTDLRPFRVGELPDDPMDGAARRVREAMVAEGFCEAVTIPMSQARHDRAVRVLNPLSAEEAYLRQDLMSGLVRQAEQNWAAGVRDIRLFEIGTVFLSGEAGQRPEETIRVAAVLSGSRAPAHWSAPSHELDRWDLKGVFSRAAALAYPAAHVQVADGAWEAKLEDGRKVGESLELQADAPPWAAPLFGFEITIDPAGQRAWRLEPLPTTPAATRDAALLVPDETRVESILGAMDGVRGSYLESVAVLSEFRGGDVPTGMRSVAFHLVFRHPDKTLRDKEVDKSFRRILTAVEQQTGVKLRPSPEPTAVE